MSAERVDGTQIIEEDDESGLVREDMETLPTYRAPSQFDQVIDAAEDDDDGVDAEDAGEDADSADLSPEDAAIKASEKHAERARQAAKQERRREQEIPEMVKQFVKYFKTYLTEEKDVQSIQTIYEDTFKKLTEKYYKNKPWPSSASIASLVDNDWVVLMLYDELYYRHLFYINPNQSVKTRMDSWKNYCKLWDHLLNSPKLDLVIPAAWLWDMIDEFIYQFQTYCVWKGKIKSRSQEEINTVIANPDVWNVVKVITYLESFVKKCNLKTHLSPDRDPKATTDADDLWNQPLYKMLGYFSLIGLLRLHCILQDYHLALRTLASVDFAQPALYMQVPSCHITLFYYLGFAFMMMRRYPDAIKIFSQILYHINRSKMLYSRYYQYDEMIKKFDQMFALLALCLSLCPIQSPEENVSALLKEKYSEWLPRLARGDEDAFGEMFGFACPKFINPAVTKSLTEGPHMSSPPLPLQTKLFLTEVRQQTMLPTIRSYLKLYTTIELNKFGTFLEMDDIEVCTQLLCYKHKSTNVHWDGHGPLLNGDFHLASDIDFYIDKEMIVISDRSKVIKRFTSLYLKNITKNRDTVNRLSAWK